MNKFIVFFQFFTGIFFFSNAQDTIVYKSGDKYVIKILFIDDKIDVKDAGGKTYRLSKRDVIKIIYETGQILNLSQPIQIIKGVKKTTITDTTTRKYSKRVSFCFSVNGGISFPLGLYASHSYYINQYGTYNQYVGFANQGYVLSATCGVTFEQHGWEIILKSDYIQQGFDAQGFFNENINWYYWNNHSAIFNHSTNFIGFNPISSKQSYLYNEWTIFLGVTKNYSYKRLSCGLSILLGDMVFKFPKIQGNASFLKQDSINESPYSKDYQWTMNKITYSLPAIDFGLKLQFKANSHISLILNFDYIFSSIQFNMPSEINDMNGNNIIDPPINTSTNISMINTSIGVKYFFN